MPLITLKDILAPSYKEGWAIGAYDTPNLAVTLGVLDAAEADLAPVIIMIYPGTVPTNMYATYSAFITREIVRRNVPAALVLDHGPSLAEIGPAIEAGFSGVMIDGSKYPLQENIDLTRKVVQMAKEAGISVEAELGHVGMGSDVSAAEEVKSFYTPVEDAQRFVSETGVDALAVAIGTVHGVYKFKPLLDFERLQALNQALDLPLVLHGASGTPDAQLARAVSLGINKVNVYTDIRMAVVERLQEKAAWPKDSLDIHDFDEITRRETERVVREKNALFGAVGKAGSYRA